MNIKEEKINNIKVSPVKLTDETKQEDIKGRELFDIFPCNIFIASKKKSGKTSLISNIIQKTTDKYTIFYLFVSTHSIDPSWKAIIEKLDKKGCEVNVFDSIYEGKINNLDNVINKLTNGDEKETIDKTKGKGAMPLNNQPQVKLFFGAGVEVLPPVEEQPKKKKYVTPKYMFIFDDISNQLKNPAVSRFMKIHRHFLASCIISSQYVKDLLPQSIAQIDYFICFKNFSVERLQHIHKLLDLSVSFDDYLKLYYYAVSEPYSFLYTNVRTEQMRKGFNKVISINS